MRIILVDSGLFHPSLLARGRLLGLLKESNCEQILRVASLSALPADLSAWNVIVLYFHAAMAPESAISRLWSFVRAGGGILAIHSATASFKKQEAFGTLLGGHFAGHDAVGDCLLEPAGSDGPFAGLPAFRVRDEMYFHDLEPDIDIAFTARRCGSNGQPGGLDGRLPGVNPPIPAVWTRRVGAGRVCHACPGHRAATLDNADYRRLILRGLSWAAGLEDREVQGGGHGQS
ncbi:MAG: ThuA domain-containing protein [Rectinemataceae bacterium]